MEGVRRARQRGLGVVDAVRAREVGRASRHSPAASAAARCRACALVALLAAPAAAGAEARARLGLEFQSGAPLQLDVPLRIRQAGHADLRFTGAYRAEPFRMPIYWALRASRHGPDGTWSAELMHHKVYLDNPPAEVQAFSVSHGFNFITLQRAWPRRLGELRAGAGFVLAHPENTVRGRVLDERRGLFNAGYHLAGPAALVAAGRRFAPRPWLSLSLEVRASVAPVEVPVDGGHARFTNLALHLLLGAGLMGPG